MPSIDLAGGRTLAYEEYGTPDGYPVLYAHGTPGARRSAEVFDDQPIRVIAPDRPGVSGSDSDDAAASAEELLAGYREDVRTLVERLDIDAFGVIGFSGGAPFALAVGQIPAATSVAVVAPAGPPDAGDDDGLAFLSRHAPILIRGLFSVQRPIVRRRPASALALYTDADPDSLPFPDGVDPVEAFAEDYLAATESGGRRPARELSAFADPWELPDPEVPVGVWYGTDDENVSPSEARSVADRVADEVTAVSGDHLETLCKSRPDLAEFLSPSV